MDKDNERNIAITQMIRYLDCVSGMKPSEALVHMDEKSQNYVKEIVGTRDIDSMTIDDFQKEIQFGNWEPM